MGNNKYTIEVLLAGCKAGKREAQAQLYRLTAPKMMAICMRYSKDQMEAEDVMQIAYVKIFQKIGEFREEGSFEGWMKRIVLNSAIENYRKNLRMLQVVNIEDAPELASQQADYSSLGMQDLMRVIQKLADGYRMVFNMYVIEGYSHKEIAETLGISEGASKSQLSRARAILQQEIIKMENYQYGTNVG